LIQSKSRKYDPKIHHIFCDCCIQNIKVCSRSKCRQIFLLKDNDFKRLKHLYISNKNNKYCFYIYEEIEQFVINKYGSLEQLNQLLKEKKAKKDNHHERKMSRIKDREIELKKVLKDNKLEYKNHGDCYSYIMYGYPSIQNIVEDQLKNIQQIGKRRIELAEQLSNKGLPFCEKDPDCYKYINNLACKTLEDVIKSVEIKYFLENDTDYLKLLEKYPECKAKDIAIRNFIKKENSLPEILHKDIIVEFE
jgi:hypothetical protein